MRAKWLMVVVLLLLTTGCAIDSTNSQPKLTDMKVWPQGQGELPNRIGSALEEPIAGSSQWMNATWVMDEEIWNKTGYALPTGRWFFHNGEGSLGYGLTSGTQKAGDPLVVSLIGHLDNGDRVDRDVRIQLTEIDIVSEEKQLVTEAGIHVEMVTKEQQIFSSLLPEDENKSYILSVEMLDEDGMVEDTRVSFIYVPKQEINAALSTDSAVYERTDSEAILILDNDGPTHLTFGTYYTIEKKINGAWHIVPLNTEFKDIGLMLHAGSQHEQTVPISDLNEGEYRIIKEFRADGLDLSGVLATEFVIQ